MRASSRFRSVFLEQMLMGFQPSAFPCRIMSLRERMHAVKLSADVAMAVARGSRRWTHGLIADLSRKEDNKSLLKCILGKQYERLTMPCFKSSWKIQRCKTILRRSFRERLARSTVKKKKKKRAQVLKRLVPGGEGMDGYSLLVETMDYVVCLQAQVHLMRHLLGAFEASKLRSVLHPGVNPFLSLVLRLHYILTIISLLHVMFMIHAICFSTKSCSDQRHVARKKKRMNDETDGSKKDLIELRMHHFSED